MRGELANSMQKEEGVGGSGQEASCRARTEWDCLFWRKSDVEIRNYPQMTKGDLFGRKIQDVSNHLFLHSSHNSFKEVCQVTE